MTFSKKKAAARAGSNKPEKLYVEIKYVCPNHSLEIGWFGGGGLPHPFYSILMV
jgi:hypothetical protein